MPSIRNGEKLSAFITPPVGSQGAVRQFRAMSGQDWCPEIHPDVRRIDCAALSHRIQ